MNIIELQENFEQACLYYASKFGYSSTIDELFLAEYRVNKNKKEGEPNYYKTITAWNHSCKPPKDSDLMKYSVEEVQSHYQSTLTGFEGATKMLLFLNGEWQEVFLKKIKGEY